MSHLLFADDLLLFFRANQEEVQTISDVLQVYATSSGLGIILKSLLSSSTVIPMWIRRRELKQHWALERWTGFSHTVGFLL